MKALLVSIALVALLLISVYYLGGFSTFDASEQGRLAKEALHPGMTFDDACDVTGDPKEFRIIREKTVRIGGEERVELVPSVPIKCTRDKVKTRIQEGANPHGFLCTFAYSNAVAFTVKYDDAGAVVGVEDATTLADLLDM